MCRQLVFHDGKHPCGIIAVPGSRTLSSGFFASAFPQAQWYGWNDSTAPEQAESVETVTVAKRASRKVWARLLANVYEIA
jgi:hypothetical protein